RDDRPGAAEAAPGDILPGLVAGATAPGGTRARRGRGGELRARGLDAEGRGPGADAGDRAALEVPSVGAGEESGRHGGEFPGAAAGRRAVSLRVAGCRRAAGAGGRPHGGRRRVDRGRGGRRGTRGGDWG